MNVHDQAIHCELLDVVTGKKQNVIGVYGYNTVEARKSLWQFLTREVP